MSFTAVNKAVKVLHFRLQQIDFAIRLSEINEIIKLTDLRRIPRVPEFIEGLLHLRGENIIIVNLRLLLQIEGENLDDSKIIIFNMFGRQVGFIVDSVSKITQIDDQTILPPPPIIIQGPAPDYIEGVLEEADRNILLIDLKKSLAALEEESINQVLERELSYLIDQING